MPKPGSAKEKFTVERKPLAHDWNARRRDGYDIVVIGSGYGGAITAARLATAKWPKSGKPTVCVLERGQEWLAGKFPDDAGSARKAAFHQQWNPTGLYKFTGGPDIMAMMGSGLGGTSLINANVAIQPDPEVFTGPRWPAAIAAAWASPEMPAFCNRVRKTLGVGPHPLGNTLSKVKALRAGIRDDLDSVSHLNDIAVNFTTEGLNRWGVKQRPCLNCGDCINGCNVGAKNTLDTNYLAIAKAGGAHLLTRVEVEHIQKMPSGEFRVHYTRRSASSRNPSKGYLVARGVVISAGAIGSTEILLRSRAQGLSLADSLGTRFSGNGDFLTFAYNIDSRVDNLGWGAYPRSDRANRVQPTPGLPPESMVHPGPTIVSSVRTHRHSPLSERITLQDLSVPSTYVEAARTAFSIIRGKDTDPEDWQDNLLEFGRRVNDFARNPDLENGALNHTVLHFVMGIDDSGGRIELDALANAARVTWPDAGRQRVFQLAEERLQKLTAAVGGTFIRNPIWALSPWKTLLTAHPLGGCPMGEDHTTGVVNHLGQVFTEHGDLHKGLYVTDGSIIPTALGVNPFLTISALTERTAEGIIRTMGGTPK